MNANAVTEVLENEIIQLSDDKPLKRINEIKDQIKFLKAKLKKAEDRQTQKESRIIELQNHIDGINNNITE